MGRSALAGSREVHIVSASRSNVSSTGKPLGERGMVILRDGASTVASIPNCGKRCHPSAQGHFTLARCKAPLPRGEGVGVRGVRRSAHRQGESSTSTPHPRPLSRRERGEHRHIPHPPASVNGPARALPARGKCRAKSGCDRVGSGAMRRRARRDRYRGSAGRSPARRQAAKWSLPTLRAGGTC